MYNCKLQNKVQNIGRLAEQSPLASSGFVLCLFLTAEENSFDLISKTKNVQCSGPHCIKKFGNGGNLNYKEALTDLQIDLDHAGLGEEKWTLYQPKPLQKDASSNAGSLTNKALSSLSRLSEKKEIEMSVAETKSKVGSIAPSQSIS